MGKADKSASEQTNPKPATLFIAYHPSDEASLQRLNTHLASLTWTGQIRTWSANEIRAGEERRTTIEREIDSALAVLLMLSADFLNSDECLYEVAYALEKETTSQLFVVPILVRACMWEYPPFSRLQILPANGQPIESWRLPEEAWSSVTHSLATMLGQVHENDDEKASAELGKVRRALLFATAIAELQECIYRLDRFLSSYPGHSDAQQLRDQISTLINEQSVSNHSPRALFWARALPQNRRAAVNLSNSNARRRPQASVLLLYWLVVVPIVISGALVASSFFFRWPTEFRSRARGTSDEGRSLEASMIANYQQGDFGAAEGVADQLLKIEPNNKRALTVKGAISYQNGDYHATIKYYSQAHQSDPVITSNLAWAYIDVGGYSRAIELLASIEDGKPSWSRTEPSPHLAVSV